MRPNVIVETALWNNARKKREREGGRIQQQDIPFKGMPTGTNFLQLGLISWQSIQL
jgi:hypothetical protein